MATGTIKLHDKGKGYGYIAPDAGGRDVFFYSTNVATPSGDVSEGQRVEYDLVVGRKGPEAVKIRLMS